jgi:hypothetical protein
VALNAVFNRATREEAEAGAVAAAHV